nr:hypothetical protein [Tanacetum cinerariifolium]
MIIPSKDTLYNGRKWIGFQNPKYFEKAKDSRPSLYDKKVIGLGYTLIFLTHSNEALEIKKFRRTRDEFAYDYGNLNASYVNEKINFKDDYIQEIINLDFEKIDSLFQQTSSLKQYVLNVILEKIIIDLKDKVVSLLEKEKENLKTIKSLKSKGFELSENTIFESENQSENDCHVVEKECDKMENPKVIAPKMFKLSVSQSVSQISMSKTSCESNNVERETSSAYVCNDAMNVSYNSSMGDLLDDNNFFIFDDVRVRISLVSKMPFRKNPRDSMNRVRTDNSTEFKNKILAKFFDEVGITQQLFAARTPQQNGVMERRNRTLVEAARTMLTFANLPLFFWEEAIATACFIQNRSIIHKRFDKTPYELMNKRKPNIKFFRVFGCRCYLLNDYEDVGKLQAKEDIRVFVGYSKESAAFRIYNKQTQPGLSNLNEVGKSSNPSVSQVLGTSKKDFEDLFHNFYDEYFDSSKIMKSSTTNVETSINEEVFHEVSESFQRESFSSLLNDDVQQTSTSHNVFNERLEDAFFDVSTSFHDLSNVHTFYQPYPHEKKWTKDHPLHKIIGDLKLSVRTRGQLANSYLFSCLLSSIEPANVAEALKDADWVSAMQEELDQFARLKVWSLVP